MEAKSKKADVDDQMWIIFFDAKDAERAGYDFPAGSVLKASGPYDPRFPDNILHPFVRLLKSMRVNRGLPPLLELRGNKEEVERVAEWFESWLRSEKRETLPMPKGFTAGWT